MQRSAIGVGDALRRVRTSRGLSIDEASRDTRIRREFLEAIEGDDFDRLLGDVHTRGCLRTYASYLRLSPDKVVAAYDAARPETEPTTATAPVHHEPVLGARRRRDNHLLLVLIAATILVLAAAFGVLSARQPAPPPAELPSDAPAEAVTAARPITVSVLARRSLGVTVTLDGAEPREYTLDVGEGRSFQAQTSLTIRLSDGGAAEVTVAGRSLGVPGVPGRPWEETYDYEPASPSPSG